MTPTDKAATNYQNINVLAGGGGGDTYNLYPGVTTPDVQVGSGINTLTFVGSWTQAVSIDLETVSGFHTINGPEEQKNTLTGNNQVNTWHITGNDPRHTRKYILSPLLRVYFHKLFQYQWRREQ